MRFYTQDNLWLEQVGIDVWRIGLTKTAPRPNGVTSSWNYEDKRNLLTQVQNGSVSDFGYTNNAIGNRTAMSRAGSAFSTPDTISYSYNSRSEVIGAVSNQNSAYNYAYNFDPIGNRLTANLAGTSYNYTTNMLNQYTVHSHWRLFLHSLDHHVSLHDFFVVVLFCDL